MEKWCPQRRPELQSTPRRLKGMSYDFADTLCSEGMGDQFGVWEELDKRMSVVMGCVGVRVHGVMTKLQRVRKVEVVLVESSQFRLSPLS